MIDSLFDIMAGVIGVDFVSVNEPSKKHRGIINTNKLLLESYGSEVIVYKTTLTTGCNCSLNNGEEIIIDGKNQFKIKNKSIDYRTRTIEYGLEKTEA